MLLSFWIVPTTPTKSRSTLVCYTLQSCTTPDHVKAVARIVIDHRLVLKPEARLKRMAPGEVTANLLARIPAPTPKGAA